MTEAMLLPGMDGERRTRDLSQFYTPNPLARFLWQWAMATGAPFAMRSATTRTVLEPACGDGALVKGMLGGRPKPSNIIAIDVHRPNYDKAKGIATGAECHMQVRCADFLEESPEPVDGCIQNPPYENGMEVAFIERSLDWAPWTCGVFRSAIVFGKERNEKLWRHHDIVRGVRLVKRPDFGGEFGAKTDFVLLDLARRERARKQGEAQPEQWEWL